MEEEYAFSIKLNRRNKRRLSIVKENTEKIQNSK